jgi:hypothetical protein
MRRLGVRCQRWLKAFHVFFASVWVGAIAGSMTILLIAKFTNAGELHFFYAAAVEVGSLVIPLLSVLTFITGALICWLTTWGFFRYWSVVFQIGAWVLVFLLAIAWLDPALAAARSISGDEGLLAQQNGEFLRVSQLAVSIIIINFITLTITMFVAVIKPWGRTGKAKA